MSSARPPAKPAIAPVAGPVATAIAATSSSTRSGAVAAGQRQPVDHGELDDDGGEEGHGEDGGRERLADGTDDLRRHLLTTTPTTPRPVKSANGLTSAVGVSEPGWVVTADTVPTGTPGTYGRPPTEPNVTSSWPGLSVGVGVEHGELERRAAGQGVGACR